uniref:mRNA decay activator protein ZFP36 n=1 Tax=Poecilia mexicana TaxID=48701 RepID=A0A3B3XWC8_9TELE
MPSDSLTPFLELDEEFCKVNSQRVLGFQRRHSLCPVTLPNSKFNSGCEAAEPACCWGLGLACSQQWSRALPRSSLSHIPFRVDRSVSMIEGNLKPPPPPPRHPKYKTEPCRTFHTIGFCPYGARCHFIHNADEVQAAATHSHKPPLLRHSLSFAGFSSSSHIFQPVQEPSCLLFTRASSVSPPPSSSGSPELLSPLLPEPGPLKHCSYPFSGIGDGGDSSLCFFASSNQNLPVRLPQQPPACLNNFPSLQRCSSADSLSEEGYTSSCSLSSSSSGTESPSFEGRRLPIFSRLSVSDE